MIIAPERAGRSSDYLALSDPVAAEEECPFCPGHEHLTPPEKMAFVNVDNPQSEPRNWTTRAFNNKYPALTQMLQSPESEFRGKHLAGIGFHEVIVDNFNHNSDFPDLATPELEVLFLMYSQRLFSYRKAGITVYPLIFRNWGHLAGATKVHPHTQIIGSPIMFPTLLQELRGCAEHYEEKNKCLFCSTVKREERLDIRIVCKNKNFVAITPEASRFPYEIMILPRKHNPYFENTQSKEFRAMAEIVKETIARLKGVLPNLYYNLLIHSAPIGLSDEDIEIENYFHWHIEILPRTGFIAGFELGAGTFINTVVPERAAEELRNVISR